MIKTDNTFKHFHLYSQENYILDGKWWSQKKKTFIFFPFIDHLLLSQVFLEMVLNVWTWFCPLLGHLGTNATFSRLWTKVHWHENWHGKSCWFGCCFTISSLVLDTKKNYLRKQVSDCHPKKLSKIYFFFTRVTHSSTDDSGRRNKISVYGFLPS